MNAPHGTGEDAARATGEPDRLPDGPVGRTAGVREALALYGDGLPRYGAPGAG
jgi:hypothetical protein